MRIRIIGGLLAAAMLLTGLYMANDFYTNPPFEADNSPAGIDRRLQWSGGELFQTLRQGFPQDYAALVNQISQALQSGQSDADTAQITQAKMAEIRKSHAQTLLAAPDAVLRAIVADSRDLHAEIRAEEGRETCNRFAIQGPAALGPALPGFVEPLSRQGNAVLQAIVEARGAALPASEPASAADWDRARAWAKARGTEPAHLEALVALDQTHGDLCLGLVGLLEGLLTLETAQGQRLRASYVRDLAAN